MYHITQKLINDVLMAYLGDESPSFEFCEYLNISVCPVTETNSVSFLCLSRFKMSNLFCVCEFFSSMS